MLDDAIAKAGGVTLLANSLRITKGAVSQWKKRRVPAWRCPAIEALTGVPCESLRPDIDWSVLRNGLKCDTQN